MTMKVIAHFEYTVNAPNSSNLTWQTMQSDKRWKKIQDFGIQCRITCCITSLVLQPQKPQRLWCVYLILICIGSQNSKSFCSVTVHSWTAVIVLNKITCPVHDYLSWYLQRLHCCLLGNKWFEVCERIGAKTVWMLLHRVHYIREFRPNNHAKKHNSSTIGNSAICKLVSQIIQIVWAARSKIWTNGQADLNCYQSDIGESGRAVARTAGWWGKESNCTSLKISS